MHMENLASGDPSHHAVSYNRDSNHPQGGLVDGSRWYFSRKEIEEFSPSRRDGITLKRETFLRKSYSSFLQKLGMRLEVNQAVIAIAITFCHRFFLRQSHAKNDRLTVATACMFLACKVGETPRPLTKVTQVSYEIINNKDPNAAQRIRQEEVSEQQKRFILLGEMVVLATLGFDLNVPHPYKFLLDAIKKFQVAQNALAQVAWNFINDGFRTSLCLQFKAHHIAAGALFLAAKFLKVKLSSDGEKVWWKELDVTPRQLEEISNQLLELYDQYHLPPSGEAGGGNGGGATNQTPSKAATNSEERAVTDNHPLGAGDHCEPSRATENESTENTSTDIRDMKMSKTRNEVEPKEKHASQNIDFRVDALGKSLEANKNIDKDKAAAKRRWEALMSIAEEERKKKIIVRELEAGVEMAAGSEKNKPEEWESWIDLLSIGDDTDKGTTSYDPDSRAVEQGEFIERELEAGVEMAAGSEKNKPEEWGSWIILWNVGDDTDEGTTSYDPDSRAVEEGEVLTVGVIGCGHQSPKSKQPEEEDLEGNQKGVAVVGSLQDEHMEDADSVTEKDQ